MFSKSSGTAQPAAETPSKRASTKAPSVPAQSRGAGVPSLLSSDLVITGDLKTDGEVQVDGRLDGNLTAGRITIGESGAVNGKIVTDKIVIRGKVTGKIEATSIELTETANVQADLVQDQLTVANGAFFDGKCSRKTPPPTPLKTTESSAKKA